MQIMTLISLITLRYDILLIIIWYIKYTSKGVLRKIVLRRN